MTTFSCLNHDFCKIADKPELIPRFCMDYLVVIVLIFIQLPWFGVYFPFTISRSQIYELELWMRYCLWPSSKGSSSARSLLLFPIYWIIRCANFRTPSGRICWMQRLIFFLVLTPCLIAWQTALVKFYQESQRNSGRRQQTAYPLVWGIQRWCRPSQHSIGHLPSAIFLSSSHSLSASWKHHLKNHELWLSHSLRFPGQKVTP